jgi:hypothetical protein
MAIDAQNNFNNHYTNVKTVRCKGVTSRGSLPGSQIVPIHDLDRQVSITAFKTFLLRFRPRHQLVDPAVKLSDRQKLVQEKIRDQLRLNAPAAPIVIP